jgi:restriction endonuclease S subunit
VSQSHLAIGVDTDELVSKMLTNAKYSKIIKEIQVDNFRGLQPIYCEGGELNVINSKHILEEHLDYDNFEKTDQQYWTIQSKARIFKEDILIYTTGANIGRTNIYLKDSKALASNHVNILRIKNENPYYVAFVLNSLIGRLQTEKLSAGSAQQELYPKDIESFVIPFVDEALQDEIKQKLLDSFEYKTKSQKLLDIAKSGVEKAIEEDEAAAMAWMESELQGVREWQEQEEAVLVPQSISAQRQ